MSLVSTVVNYAVIAFLVIVFGAWLYDRVKVIIKPRVKEQNKDKDADSKVVDVDVVSEVQRK